MEKSAIPEAGESGQKPRTDSTDIVFDSSSGISEEDQKEILSRIDMAARENSISVKAENLRVQAKRRGYLFPLFVNIGALLLLISIFFILSAFYKSSDLDLRMEVIALRSAEGRLLQEFRRETANQMKEKERQIASIAARLEDIDRERQNMQSGIEERIRGQEEELRRRMREEVETERRRLSAQGLSEPAIAERIRPFEEEKTSQFNAETEEFRRQTETERLMLETNLENLQKEFQENLRELEAERLRIIEYAQTQEETLRARMEEKSRELSRAYEQNKQELAEAREELRQLTESQERSNLIEGQINGYFNTLNKRIDENDLEEAANTLGIMRNFLNEPAIQDFQVIRNRKDITMAVIDALSTLIEESRQNRREKLSIARALQSGIAAVEASKPGGGAEENAWTGAVSDALARAETAYRAGDYRQAMDAYAAALAAFPAQESPAGRIREHILRSSAGAAQEVYAEQGRRDDPEALRILRQAEGYYAAGQYNEAGAAYLSIIENHSPSAQTRAAFEGLKKSLEAQNSALSNAGASAAAYEGITKTLREQNLSLIQTIENLQKTHQIDLQAQELRLRNELSGGQ
jgi:hypothetical protein